VAFDWIGSGFVAARKIYDLAELTGVIVFAIAPSKPMAQQEVARLFRTAQTNPSLRERLNSAPDAESFVQMAQELGFDFTVEEWKQATGFAVEELKCQLSEIPGI
jgi:predicted ribosomally synthesized peptide with nif11-like leader